MPFQPSDNRGEGGDPQPTIETFISRCLGQQAELEEVIPLKGDASDRSYYRVRLDIKGGKGAESLLVMRLAEPYSDGELPFVNICNYLDSLGLAVPRIHSYHREWGMLALEDCGDVTLQEAFRAGPPAKLRELYYRAVDDLIIMQLSGTAEQRARCRAYGYAFDEERFVWELNFTLKHWVSGLLKRPIAEEDDRTLQEIFRGMARTMLEQKLYFTHRDYHSRNLMVQGDRLRILDFQDARLGPPQYDLASLLRDSYVQLPSEWEEELLDYYLDRRRKEEGAGQGREKFVEIFNTTCLQRNLKAIGTFASQKALRGNDAYLQYIPTTLAHIKRNLLEHREFTQLGDILAGYVPSF